MATNLRELIPAMFVGPNGEPLTQDQIEQRQAIAASLLQQATDTSPNAGGWASVLAKGVQGGIAGYKNRQADRATAENSAYDSAALGKMFSNQAPASATPAYPSSVASGGSSVGAVEPAVLKQGLIARGLPEHVADGFLMNFADESGFKSGINEQNPTVAGSRGGFGLYQLTGPRRVAYEQFARQQGVSPDSTDAQLDFLVSELKGPEAGAAKAIFAAPDAGTAAAAIVNKFLRPAEDHRAARANKYITRPQKYAGMTDAPLVDAALSGDAVVNPNPTVAEALSVNQPQIGIPMPGEPGSGLNAQQAQELALAAEPTAQGRAAIQAPTQVIDVPPVETVASVASMPAGSPGEIRQGPDGQTYQYAETTGMQGATGQGGWIPVNAQMAQAGAPMAQPPMQDATYVPSLSAAPNIPFVGQDGQPSPVAAALVATPAQMAQATPTGSGSFPPAPSGPVNAAPVQQPGYLDNAPRQSVAQALLPIRAQADPNDRLVADVAHTVQPTAAQLQQAGIVAPQQAAAQAQPDQLSQYQRVLADPRASPQTKQVALGLLQQKEREAQAVRQQQAEQEQWYRQKQYEQQQQEADPLRQAQIRKAQADADAAQNPKPGYRFLSAPEVQAMGLDPKKQYQQAADGKVTAVGDNGVNVQVNTGENTNDFRKKADEKAAERFDGYIVGGRQASQQISDMQTLVDLGKQIKTGKGAQALVALGPYAELAGIKIDNLGPAQAYKSITDRLAPAMRVPGSGSSSDIDVRMFLNSLPNIGNSPEANAVINGTFQSIAQNKQQAADLALRATSGEMTWQEAEKQISALPNPYENFKKFKKDNPSMFNGELTDEPPPPATGGYRVIGVE